MKLQLPSRFSYAIAILVLSGCANQEAFQKGKLLLDQSKPEEAFVQLQKAVDEQPHNIEYLRFFYRQRENWINKLLREADAASINHQWEQAKSVYERVLKIDQQNQRAQEGLQQIERGQHHEELLADANNLVGDGNDEMAMAKVRAVLAEDPQNTEAKSLRSRIDSKKSKLMTPEGRLNAKFRKPVTLEFKDASIKTVFEMLSKASGVNFILDKELQPDLKVSIFVKNTSIESALQNIFATTQLSKRILNDNSVLVYPSNKKSDYQEMVVKTFYLNNVDPKQAQNLIQTVVKTKDIFIDEKLNILVMRDTAEAVHLAGKLMAAYDISDPEVLLEVEVLEVATNKLQELGIRFPNQLSIGVAGSGGGGQLTFKEAQHFGPELGRITITDPALILNLRATDSDTNLLANPQIRVKSHKKAKIHIGDRVPVITSTSTSTGFVSESVSYLDVGLKLDVEPSVMVENEVSMDVGLEVSNIVSEVTSKNGTLAYRVGTRNANTTLRLKNGETQILAGLLNDEERSSADRVPGLSSLPLIGRLFSSKQDTHNKTEIVLLITPHIVRNIVTPDSGLTEFSTGTESGNTAVTGEQLTLQEGDAYTPAIMPQPGVTPPPVAGLPAFSQDAVTQSIPPAPLIPPPPPLPSPPPSNNIGQSPP